MLLFPSPKNVKICYQLLKLWIHELHSCVVGVTSKSSLQLKPNNVRSSCTQLTSITLDIYSNEHSKTYCSSTNKKAYLKMFCPHPRHYNTYELKT